MDRYKKVGYIALSKVYVGLKCRIHEEVDVACSNDKRDGTPLSKACPFGGEIRRSKLSPERPQEAANWVYRWVRNPQCPQRYCLFEMHSYHNYPN